MSEQGLDFQTVTVDFTGGLDTRTNRKLRVPGKWDLLLNCTHSGDGSLAKRDGVRALVPDANGHGLFTFDDELLALDGTSVVTTTINPGVAAVGVAGKMPCLHLEKKEIDRAANQHDSADCAYGNGLEVYVWHEITTIGFGALGIYFCAIDSTTRALVVGKTLLSATGYYPRVVQVSGSFMFFWMQGAPNLFSAVYSPGVGIGGATDLGIALGPNGSLDFFYDAVAFGFDAVRSVFTAAVSYAFADGSTSVRCSKVSFDEITLVPNVIAWANLITEAELPCADICGLGIGIMGGQAGVYGFAATIVASPSGLGSPMNGVAGAAINDAWSPSDATLIDGTAIFSALQPTHVVVTRWPVPQGNWCQAYVDGFADAGGVGGTGVRPLRSYAIIVNGPATPLVVADSKTLINSVANTNALALQGPFIAGGPMVISAAPAGGLLNWPETIALPVCFYGPGTGRGIIQSGIYLLDGNTGVVLGKAMYGRLGSHSVGAMVPSTPARADPTVIRAGLESFILPVREHGRLALMDGDNYTQSGISALLVTPNLPVGANAAAAWAPRKTQLGRAALVANGMLAMYDGQAICEADFNVFPEGIGVSVAVGGGTWVAGTYEFLAIYEWVDGQGQRHQSAPSPTVQVVVSANATLTFRVPTLMLTQRAGVKHVLYGTQPNGTTFTRFGTTLAPVDIDNDKTLAQSSTVVLAGTPASNELLYSQPFVADTTLPNDAPSPCSQLGVHQQRLWVDVSDQAGAFRYSQQLIAGVGLQFNEVLGGQLPVEAGAITGFASMDEVMIIFAERKIFRITGTGPTPSGGYNGYSDPVEIPSDVGCSTPSSVISIPTGVMFRSSKGWYLLTRDLSVKYVGGPIKRWDTDIITSAVLMEDRQEIRVSSRHTYDSGFSGALQFCYSYVADTWSTFQVTSFSVALKNCYLVFDAVWWPTLNRYVSIGYYDGLNNDTPGTYLDWVGTNSTGFAIGMSARSSFLHLTSLEGFQRVRWLYLTASGPTAPATALSFRIDFDDLYATQHPPGAPGCYLTSPLTLTAIPFANPAAVDLRHKFRRQKCKSVAITINENPVSAGAAGLTGFQVLALQIGAKRGVNRLPAAQGVP